MTHYQEIICPKCGSKDLMKAGRNAYGEQRYRCQ
ncbi:MAG: IS1/IS1595 family N-terminal zinc-binding domain-containing protein, partial [Methylococcaceae bacterium]